MQVDHSSLPVTTLLQISLENQSHVDRNGDSVDSTNRAASSVSGEMCVPCVRKGIPMALPLGSY